MKNTENTPAKKLKGNRVENIIYILLASPALFLLVNRYPYLLVLSVLSVLILSFVFLFKRQKITSYHYPVLLILTLIYSYFIFSYFFSGQYISNFFSYDFLRTNGNFFFCYILFFALAVPFFNYRKVSDYFFKFTFVVFSAFSLVGIFEYITGLSSFTLLGSVDRGMMFVGLNIAHNATGSIYALVSVFALIFFLQEKTRRNKILYGVVFALSGATLFLTKSRGSYIAFFAVALFVLWMHLASAKKFFITVSAITVISVPILWVTNMIQRFVQILMVDGTAAVRVDLWQKAWELFTKSPLFGVGFGRYNDIRSVLFENLAGYDGFWAVFLHPRFTFGFGHAHNSYLQFLAETGILGLGLLLSFWVLCFHIIFKAYKASKDSFNRKTFLAGLSAILLLFVLSLTENYFSATIVMIGSSMVVSLCLGLGWQERAENRDS